MDEDFETLLEYLGRKNQLVQVSSGPEKKCVLESIETDDEFVCQKCDLVLGQVYNPDVP